MSMFRPVLAVRLVGLTAVICLLSLGETATAAMPTVKAKTTTAASHAIQPAVNHSAPYTRLLGTAWPAGPVKFADHSSATAKTSVRTIGWHHRAYPYYAGYGGYGGYGGLYGPYGYGSSYGVPYYAAYGSYGFGGLNYYQPWSYSYQPWIGGWSGYPYYSSFAPGFGSYYNVGYRSGVGYYGGGSPGYGGGFGGCCYW
jgi:hypothetical protein